MLDCNSDSLFYTEDGPLLSYYMFVFVSFSFLITKCHSFYYDVKDIYSEHMKKS